MDTLWGEYADRAELPRPEEAWGFKGKEGSHKGKREVSK